MSENELLKQLVANQSRQDAILEKLATKEMHTKTPANFGTYTEIHGNGSIFGSASVEREVVTAHMRPHGIGAILDRIPSVAQTPFFPSITGFTATTGDEAATPCADNPQGYLKGCLLTAQYGRVARDTQTIEMDKVMLRKNRGDFDDLVLYGELIGETGFSPDGITQADLLRTVTKAEMVTAAVNLERSYSYQMWNGSPANNNPGGGYKEMPGLANQVATGQVDALSNTACPAMDSDVKTFGYDELGGSGAQKCGRC